MADVIAFPVKFHKASTSSESPPSMSRLFESDAQRYLRNYDDAMAYHDRACQFDLEGQRPSVIFNVAAVAIECYLIALCARFKVMPMNHSYGSLLEDATLLVRFPPELEEAVRSLDKIFGICSLDDYYHGVPEADDAERSLHTCQALRKLINGLPANMPGMVAIP
jgi:HEPN domain-containing protein